MKPLNQFYSFTTYNSREDYEARTGKKAEPWNPNRRLKYWADENPTNTEFDEIRGEEATYKPVPSIQANGRYRDGADGHPTVGKMTLSVGEAKTYNFPPAKGIFPAVGERHEGETITARHIANAQQVVQSPLNLPDGARVVYAPGIGSIAAVLLKGESLPSSGGSCNCNLSDDQIDRVAARIVEALKAEGFLVPASE